jgi:hypothetical protein
MNHCSTLAPQGPHRPRRFERISDVTVYALGFTRGPIPQNRQPRFQTARSISTADSDFSSNTSIKRIACVEQARFLRNTRDAASLPIKSRQSPRRDFVGKISSIDCGCLATATAPRCSSQNEVWLVVKGGEGAPQLDTPSGTSHNQGAVLLDSASGKPEDAGRTAKTVGPRRQSISSERVPPIWPGTGPWLRGQETPPRALALGWR